MTCKRLICYCTTNDGKCERCIYTRYCDEYKKMFGGDSPLDDDDEHPERFTNKKIEIGASV